MLVGEICWLTVVVRSLLTCRWSACAYVNIRSRWSHPTRPFGTADFIWLMSLRSVSELLQNRERVATGCYTQRAIDTLAVRRTLDTVERSVWSLTAPGSVGNSFLARVTVADGQHQFRSKSSVLPTIICRAFFSAWNRKNKSWT
jgi:hypothetical protein